MRKIIILLFLPFCLFAQDYSYYEDLAYDALPDHYNGTAKIKVKDELENLSHKKKNERKKAAWYILALFKQSFADETNGRDVLLDSPFFGQGAESQARKFREDLGKKFVQARLSDECVPIIKWLLYEEKLPANQNIGVRTLTAVKGDAADSLIVALIEDPSSNEDILMGVIRAAYERKLKIAIPALTELANHHRKNVRRLVKKVAKDMKFDAELPKFDPVKAVNPWLDSVINLTYDMILHKIPSTAAWTKIIYTYPTRNSGDEAFSEQYQGWILSETREVYRLLDYSGQVIEIKKDHSQRMGGSLKQAILDHTKTLFNDDSPFGRGLLRQHEGINVLPAFTLAAWGYKKGYKKEAALLMFKMIDSYKDDRWFLWMATDYLGHMYHNDMLQEYSLNRNYAEAEKFAEHLSKSYFDAYTYQPRAQHLVKQLKKYPNDYKDLKLPKASSWEGLKESLSRADQVKYLADRLHLIQCIQPGQPAGVNYTDKQIRWGLPYTSAWNTEGNPDTIFVINPYNELLKMNLTIEELKILIPHIEEDLYFPTYSYWRDFSSSRTLHRVSWLISDIFQKTVIFDLAELRKYYDLDESKRKKHLKKIESWCEKNKSKTAYDLLESTINNTKKWSEFSYAINRCVYEGFDSLAPNIAARIEDFDVSDHQVIAEALYKLHSPDIKSPMRNLLASEENVVKIWACLYLMEMEGPRNTEGIDKLTKILEDDDGEFLYPKVFYFLLDDGSRKAFELAEKILTTEAYMKNSLYPYQEDMLRKLITFKSEKARKYVHDGLSPSSLADYEDTRYIYFVRLVHSWKTTGNEFDENWSDDQLKKEAKKLREWFMYQFTYLVNGEEHEINTEFENNDIPEWFIDSP